MSEPYRLNKHRNWTKDDDCIPEPTVKNAVLEYIRAIECSFTLADLRALGTPQQMNRVLDRLLKAGIVSRIKIPNDAPMRRGGSREVFLYTLVEAPE